MGETKSLPRLPFFMSGGSRDKDGLLDNFDKPKQSLHRLNTSHCESSLLSPNIYPNSFFFSLGLPARCYPVCVPLMFISAFRFLWLPANYDTKLIMHSCLSLSLSLISSLSVYPITECTANTRCTGHVQVAQCDFVCDIVRPLD